jgi:nucleoside-diphosphate-sugar epimerase
MDKRRVLVTGPGGRIGPHILPTFKERYDLRLLDRKPVAGEPEAVVADLSDIPTLKAAFAGCEAVLHLAATSDEAPFLEELVPNNVVGVYNVYQAAVEAGVRRVVFASTVQTVSYYPREVTVEVTDPPRPVTLYGCTKVFGETLGKWYHEKHGLSVVCVRIGWFQPYDTEHGQNPGFRAVWLSPRDAAGIFAAALDAGPEVGYALVNATSKTVFERLSLTTLRETLGYEPVDDVATLFPAV